MILAFAVSGSTIQVGQLHLLGSDCTHYYWQSYDKKRISKSVGRVQSKMWLLLLAVYGVLASFAGVALSHNIQMGAHSRECFHEQLHKDDKMTVTFQVGDREFGGAGNLEIDFWVGYPFPVNLLPRRNMYRALGLPCLSCCVKIFDLSVYNSRTVQQADASSTVTDSRPYWRLSSLRALRVLRRPQLRS